MINVFFEPMRSSASVVQTVPWAGFGSDCATSQQIPVDLGSEGMVLGIVMGANSGILESIECTQVPA